jgi:hypothetical protein
LTEELQTIINEFRTLSPDITATVIFKLDGETLATNEGTTPEQTQSLISNLNDITQTECIGGIEELSIQDVDSQLAISVIGDVYLATISSRTGDQKKIKSLTQVIAPAAILLDSKSSSKKVQAPKIIQEPLTLQTETNPPEEKQPENTAIYEGATEVGVKTSAMQFMVEKIGGLLIASDTVRIDSEIIENWQELYTDKQFSKVIIESLEGKSVTCRFKPQKNSKTNSKGIIGIPYKILQTLECDKGKLVMARPVIE